MGNIPHRLSARIEILRLLEKEFSDLVPDQGDFGTRLQSKFNCNEERHVEVATFNYDTLIEDHLNSALWEYLPAISPSPYKGQSNEFALSATRRRAGILKLHGSVNWYSHGFGSTALSDQYYVEKDDEARPSLRKSSVPTLVPFSFNRAPYTEGSLYSAIWKKFAMALEDADNVEILGYGFPPTDLYALPLLMKSQGKVTRVVNREKPPGLPKPFEDRFVEQDLRDVFFE